jgi:2-C-methyl-D-erythritol 4-phosphate cytidylyltransferase
MASKSVIITAGGVGKRMGSDIPKQFLLIGNKPIILHTIERFLKYDSAIELILVVPEEYVHIWEEICQKYLFTTEHKVALGGAERFHSIQNGLALATADLVAVHDAVRPLVDLDVIATCFDAAEKNGAAIPVFSISESVRKIEHDKSFSVNRDDYKLVQTPQCFQASILQHAYEQHYSHLFTDDASVVEADGVKTTLVEGNRENIKITTPHDLKLAELFLR